MKRKFTYLLTALALLAFLSPTTAWGGVKLADTQRITQKSAHETMLGMPDGGEMTRSSETFTYSDYTGQGTQSSGSEYTMVKTAVSIKNTKFYGNTDYAHFYANGTTTVTPASGVTITGIVLTATSTSYNGYQSSGTITVSTGTMSHDGTTVTWTGSASSAFTISNNKQIRWTTIAVTYSAGGPQPTTYTVTYDAGDGTGTMTDPNSPYAAGSTVTLLTNTFTAPTGYEWSGWEVTDANDNVVSVSNNQFTMPASDVTVTAQWTQSGGSGMSNAIYTIASASSVTTTGTAPTGSSATFNNTYSNNKEQLTAGNSMTLTLSGYQGKTIKRIVLKMHSNASKGAGWMYANAGTITLAAIGSENNGVAFNDQQWNGSYTTTYSDVEIAMSNTTYPIGTNENVVVYIKATENSLFCQSFTVYYEEASNDPAITLTPASIDLGNVVVGEQISETFTVAQANLTADIALNASVGSLNPSIILQGAAATQVTWTYTPATAGAINATVTATSGTLSETLNITGLAKEVHNITIASMTNGTVTASPNSAVEGETITLTVTPNTGYTLDALTVTNTTTSLPVTVTNNTFEMPDAPVTVSATFSAIQAMTVAQAITAIDNAANNEVEGAYVRGIISQIDNYSSQYHSITYWISDDGTTATQLQVYSGKGLNGANFNAMTDLAVGDQVVVYGDLKMHNSIYEFNYDNYLYSLSRPSITVNPNVISLAANETDGTTDIAITDIAITDPWEDCHVTFYTDATGATVTTQPAWVIDATVAEENNAYLVSCAVYANEGPARTAYFKVYAYDAYQNVVYSNMVTLTQAAVFAPAPTTSGWVLTALEDIAPGDVFVIVGNNGDDYAMTNDNGASDGPAAFSVTVQDDVLTGTIPDNIKWNISGNAINGYTFYPYNDAENWLYTTNTNDGVRVGTNTNKTFTISEEGYLYNTATSRYVGIYNSEDWRCYTSINNNIADQTFAFYKYSNVTSYTKTIQPYSGNGGYVLIAAPVEGVAPTAANGFLTNNYDLYRFDQSRQEEWLNYKAEPFYLIPGKGYLYANSGNNGQATTLTFTGTPYTGNGQITLTNDANADFAGWNLIGNPYATGMILKDANNGNKAFYTLNPAGNELMGGEPGATIAAMEGVFVAATTDGEVVSFVEETGGGGAGGGGFDFISLNVSRNRGASAGSATIDRAIIGIGDGPMLHKFQLNPSNTKIYITEANQDYAIVRSANEAELPVSFRASENGTYTISVETRNVKMDYLHLIDNMTGTDVDLLQTPSYTFEAKTSDYASRFRLVFNANNTDEDGASTGSATFAYFNGSSWTISNMGEATLQVVDVMGRVLSSETLSGNAEVNINQPTGVYMLRLVSGDSVKMQKVVVR